MREKTKFWHCASPLCRQTFTTADLVPHQLGCLDQVAREVPLDPYVRHLSAKLHQPHMHCPKCGIEIMLNVDRGRVFGAQTFWDEVETGPSNQPRSFQKETP